jgi:dCMP deaminase
MRLTIDEYFMNIAEVVATRSTCLRNNVGAVIARDKRIISTGYNGAPRNLEHCLDIGCIRDQAAEQNAIIQAALHGVSTKDATIYCTHQPCILCAKMIINAHIVRVVFRDAYPDTMAIEFFAEAGVEVVRMGEGKSPAPDPAGSG